MTKLTITREQLEEWVAQFDEDGGCDATDRQLEALIRQSLAAMDSEPVAEVLSNRPGNDTSTIDRAIPVGTQLYRHAQPDASHLSRICAESYQVVGALAEALRIFNYVGVIKALDNLSAQEIIHDDVLPFSVPEAAQQPVVPDDVLNALQDVARIRADLNNLDGDCRGVGSCLWEAEERLLEIVAQRSAMLSGGKS